MSGCILGCYGMQRSGKTAMGYLIAENLRTKHGIPVYSNMSVDGWIPITSLREIPLDKKAKILMLDEVYYFMDSRSWKDNTAASIFFNTIGKQNIFLIITAINIQMVDKRLREQHNYVILAKNDESFLSYRILDVLRNKARNLQIKKTAAFFNSLKYDTLQVPDYVDCDFSFLKQNNQRKNNII